MERNMWVPLRLEEIITDPLQRRAPSPWWRRRR
jgi:hypothetical protein